MERQFPHSFRISPYSVRMRKNTDQNNSKYGHFSRRVNELSWAVKTTTRVETDYRVHQILKSFSKTPPVLFPKSKRASEKLVLFHNIPSLKKHHGHVKSSSFYSSSIQGE